MDDADLIVRNARVTTLQGNCPDAELRWDGVGSLRRGLEMIREPESLRTRRACEQASAVELFDCLDGDVRRCGEAYPRILGGNCDA